VYFSDDTNHPDYLTNSLQRIPRSYTIVEILLIEFDILSLRLQQACQLISLHYRYTISHTNLITSHLYRIRRQCLLSNCHPCQSIEIRMEHAHILFSIKGMCTDSYTPSQDAQAKARNTGKSFANFFKPLASAVWHQDITCNHSASKDTLPSTGRTQANFKITCDSLKTSLCLSSSFITRHSALNAMSLFSIRTQSHRAIPTHTYHFEDNMRNLYGDRLCTRCTTDTLGCETHVILECTYSRHLVSPLINKLRSLLSKAGQPPWDSLPTSQQISIILGNPPFPLPTKLHKVWT